ncbi:MAG TPA: 3-dehydroquinate synthase [Porphyromonadaceae bacterium]|jgi:3-dehydroquinate synthase|uniref:3-dehydroquinate synthase n=1 Tax=Limibacterium fermenti TaxID=3229863 RepID=UPI000E962304|nr:3-dehydroquinate synthase [Porphyromonadaceae bacterium]HBL32703.1 3-dehydroquinate synthase [Porphyromonadaceae bacterium]HBX21901.1 3-dehydroquinate synthase [Porphyromonadaceae bacterium]HBX45846.1 3-dehydroquinate synthase [Porphyromonadaceae bacterium]HCM21461.1 3-dehydroquinate synthase [Porphyromonadaceae bacterium]
MQQIIKCGNITADTEQTIHTIRHDKLFVLTDEYTNRYCLPMIEGIPAIREAQQIVIPANDTNKTIENVIQVWRNLTQKGATRHSLLINLGGGMVTDLGGFAAATFKRGITYINIPTTLLGAVDAAVGGKTGVNFEGLKNEIGAFYPAEYVLIWSEFFRTLPQKEILSGFAEMIKHALIHSQLDLEKLLTFSANDIDYAWLNDMVHRSVSIKEAIVEKDPFEKNIRKALNLGHTVGHAFESFAIEAGKPVPHGYAVAWGLIAELYLSHRLCDFPKEKVQKTVRFLQANYGALPIGCDDYEALFKIMQHDKKNEAGVINFTLLSDIGNVKIDQNADKELIFEALDFYRDSVGL